MSMPAALSRRRGYAGPALLAYGFRPFFLAAGLWAASAILLWLPQYFGHLELPTAFGALDWHMHEMLYGYVAAAVAGFLLTAIPNWTGRLPVSGWPLGGLALLWAAGRLAILFSARIGAATAAVVDIAFLATLAAVAGREIVAGKNWRNLRVLLLLGALIVGDAVFHAEVIVHGAADYGPRIGLGAIVLLLSLIGGRIVPSFTHNWLARHNPGRLPTPFSRFDAVTLAGSACALLAWMVAPTHPASGAMLTAAGLLQLIRVARWGGHRTFADPLVLVLHVGYLFVPAGFFLVGASALTAAVPPTAGIHAWTTGAIGLMTLAVMTRATLGHTGQALQAGPATQAIYALVLAAALLRIGAAFAGSHALLEWAGATWVIGFFVFVVVYGPLLVASKPTWSGGR